LIDGHSVGHTCAVNRSVSLLTLVLVGLLAPACGKSIGDGCRTNIDCASDGTRICDLSQPGGYCTVDGCDDSSCPGSICVRFFDQKYPTGTCSIPPGTSPGTVGTCSSPPSTVDECRTSGQCLSDELCVVCGPSASAPEPYACCVPSTSERRYCAHKCGNDGDCRGGYVCQASDTLGSLALLPNPSDGDAAKFCAPKEE
jgi:hypothetical protein